MKHPDRFVAVDVEALSWTVASQPNGDPKGVRYRTVFNGRDGFPMVHMNEYEPNWTEARHRHAEDEILSLVRGSLTVEGVTYAAPAVIFVGRGTLYGPLQSGPDGALFLRVGYTEAMIQAEPALAAEAVG